MEKGKVHTDSKEVCGSHSWEGGFAPRAQLAPPLSQAEGSLLLCRELQSLSDAIQLLQSLSTDCWGSPNQGRRKESANRHPQAPSTASPHQTCKGTGSLPFV